jgi:molybdate transport system ATP-binding protein
MNAVDAKLSVRYRGVLGGFELDVAFDVPMRGITALFGPSGCGKTTILRCVAGLNRLPGRLSVGDEVWQDDETGTFLASHERRVGYVFQEASLFAHMSVRGNLLYGHRRALKKGAAENTRFDEVLELLGIGHLVDRATGKLSGGERQRIALGRALLAQPRIFLMDEPLSALDQMTKEEILPYFEALRTSSSLPALYVSHDISEIERLADNLVLLDSGRVLAARPLNEVLADSRLPIARSPQASTVLEARVGRYAAEEGLTELAIGGEPLLVPRRVGKEGGTDRVRIAAIDVSLAVERPSLTTILNVVPVRVKDVHPLDEAQVNVLVGIGHRDDGPLLLARITRRALRVLGFVPGQNAYAQIKAVSLIASASSGPLQPPAGRAEMI